MLTFWVLTRHLLEVALLTTTVREHHPEQSGGEEGEWMDKWKRIGWMDGLVVARGRTKRRRGRAGGRRSWRREARRKWLWQSWPAGPAGGGRHSRRCDLFECDACRVQGRSRAISRALLSAAQAPTARHAARAAAMCARAVAKPARRGAHCVQADCKHGVHREKPHRGCASRPSGGGDGGLSFLQAAKRKAGPASWVRRLRCDGGLTG